MNRDGTAKLAMFNDFISRPDTLSRFPGSGETHRELVVGHLILAGKIAMLKEVHEIPLGTQTPIQWVQDLVYVASEKAITEEGTVIKATGLQKVATMAQEYFVQLQLTEPGVDDGGGEGLGSFADDDDFDTGGFGEGESEPKSARLHYNPYRRSRQESEDHILKHKAPQIFLTVTELNQLAQDAIQDERENLFDAGQIQAEVDLVEAVPPDMLAAATQRQAFNDDSGPPRMFPRLPAPNEEDLVEEAILFAQEDARAAELFAQFVDEEMQRQRQRRLRQENAALVAFQDFEYRTMHNQVLQAIGNAEPARLSRRIACENKFRAFRVVLYDVHRHGRKVAAAKAKARIQESHEQQMEKARESMRMFRAAEEARASIFMCNAPEAAKHERISILKQSLNGGYAGSYDQFGVFDPDPQVTWLPYACTRILKESIDGGYSGSYDTFDIFDPQFGKVPTSAGAWVADAFTVVCGWLAGLTKRTARWTYELFKITIWIAIIAVTASGMAYVARFLFRGEVSAASLDVIDFGLVVVVALCNHESADIDWARHCACKLCAFIALFVFAVSVHGMGMLGSPLGSV